MEQGKRMKCIIKKVLILNKGEIMALLFSVIDRIHRLLPMLFYDSYKFLPYITFIPSEVSNL